MEKLFQKVDTVFVTVENIERSLAWYRDCLGLNLIWQNDYVYVLSAEGETPVTLLHKRSPEDEYPLFNFLTPDIEKAHAHLKECGIDVEPVIDTPDLKTFDFKDPEGNRLNVCYLKQEESEN